MIGSLVPPVKAACAFHDLGLSPDLHLDLRLDPYLVPIPKIQTSGKAHQWSVEHESNL